MSEAGVAAPAADAADAPAAVIADATAATTTKTATEAQANFIMLEIAIPTGKKLEYPVPPIVQLNEVRQYLLDSPDCWFITRFNFVVDNAPVSDFAEVGTLVPKSELDRPAGEGTASLPRLKLRVNPIPYDLHSMLFHLRTLRRSVAFSPHASRAQSLFFSIAGTREDIAPVSANAGGESKTQRKNRNKRSKKKQQPSTTSQQQAQAPAAPASDPAVIKNDSPAVDGATAVVAPAAAVAAAVGPAASVAAEVPVPAFKSVVLPSDVSHEPPSLRDFYPPSLDSFPRALRSVRFAGWNPPRGPRRLRGDLVYLDVDTLEGRHLCVTGAERGFYVNASTAKTFDATPVSADVFPTLPALLAAHSALFKGNFASQNKCRAKMDLLEYLPLANAAAPWLVPVEASARDLDNSAAEEEFLRAHGVVELPGQARDWNEDFQVLYSRAAEPPNRVTTLNNLFRTHMEFVQASQAGAQAVVDGEIAPLNPYDEPDAFMWQHNGIFFSLAANVRGVYDGQGGEVAAHKNVAHDLFGVRLLREVAVPGLHACATAVVDYRGRRVVCQSVVPGLLSQSSQSAEQFHLATAQEGSDPLVAAAAATTFGPSDDLKTYSEHPEFAKLAQALCDQLLLHTSVVDFPAAKKTVRVAGPLEMRGLIGGDGRKYLFELVRMLPRDARFPDKEHSYYLLRRELVHQYREHVINMALQQARAAEEEKRAKAAASGETQGGAVTGDAEKGPEGQQEQPTVSVPDMRVNVNSLVFSDRLVYEDPLEQKRDMGILTSMSTFLVSLVIPAFIEQTHAQPPSDLRALVPLMHEFGINARYLGLIAPHAKEGLARMCVEEMVVRGAKARLRAELRKATVGQSAEVAASFLNRFLGSRVQRSAAPNKPTFFGQPALWEEIRLEVTRRFAGYTLVLDQRLAGSLRRLSMLRSLCLAMGLSVAARDYAFDTATPFTPDDIMGFHPRTKHFPPELPDVPALIGQGRLYLTTAQTYQQGLHDLEDAMQIVYHVMGPHNTQAADTHQMLAKAYFDLGDYVAAVQHTERAVLILERFHGADHSTTLRAYGNLALYYNEAGHPERALPFMRRVLYLNRLVAGPADSSTLVSYLNLAMILQGSSDLPGATSVLLCALGLCERQEGGGGGDLAMVTRLCRALATTYQSMGQYKDALTYEKRCNKLLLKFYPPTHEKVQESNELLKTLTGAAVRVATAQREQREQRDPAAVAAADVALAAASDARRRGPVLPKPSGLHGSALPIFGKGARRK